MNVLELQSLIYFSIDCLNWTQCTADLREPLNKSHIFSVDDLRAYIRKQRAQCDDVSLPSFPNKGDKLLVINPTDLAEKFVLGVNGFRQTTRLPIIVALITSLSGV